MVTLLFDPCTTANVLPMRILLHMIGDIVSRIVAFLKGGKWGC